MTLARKVKLARLICAMLAALMVMLAVTRDASAFGCAVSATSIDFGNYRALRPGDLVSLGTISYSCTGTRGRISIALSQGSAESVRLRSMRQGAKTLSYNLYLDPTGSSIWGDGTDGSQVYVARGSADGVTVRLTVYGKVPPRQDVSVGDYRDSIMVNLNF
jgi:spore coat protein U-like protein